jgi:Tol biopolymer transport system component
MTEPVTLRVIQPDDLFRLRFLQEARLSPDGRAVVYGVSHVEKDQTKPGQADAEDVEYMTLWLLDVASGAERQLTAGTARDWSPRWSPDGKQVAFLPRGQASRRFTSFRWMAARLGR